MYSFVQRMEFSRFRNCAMATSVQRLLGCKYRQYVCRVLLKGNTGQSVSLADTSPSCFDSFPGGLADRSVCLVMGKVEHPPCVRQGVQLECLCCRSITVSHLHSSTVPDHFSPTFIATGMLSRSRKKVLLLMHCNCKALRAEYEAIG